MVSRLRQLHRRATLGTLAGGIAHDLNNLLTPVLLALELSLADAPDGSPHRERLAAGLRAAERARALLQQSVACLRDEGERLQPQALLPLVQRSLTFVEPLLPRGVELRRRFCAHRDRVATSAPLVCQLLLNLCLNAAQAVSSGDGFIEVGLEDGVPEAGGGQTHVRLSVRDSGCGMPPEVAARAFEPFFTTREAAGRLGLGLTVVHDIVVEHGGEIAVESVSGEGTCFTVSLSLAPTEP